MKTEELPTLTSISSEKWSELSKKVKRANGKAIIIVHPFFNSHPGSKYNNSLKKLLVQSKTPVIVLEEHTKIESTKKRFEKMGVKEQPLILATNRSHGAPILSFDRGEGLPFYRSDFFLENLISRLKGTGIKQIWVGGSNATTDARSGDHSKLVRNYEKKRLPRKAPRNKDEYVEPPFIAGCAGTNYRFLVGSKKFDQIAWLPKASVFIHDKGCKPIRVGSPYPPPSSRCREIRKHRK